MILTQILQPNCVKVPVESKDKEAAITELVDLLDANGLFLDRDEALEAVLTRERTRSTRTGAGIAIPHGKCNAVKDIVMAIGITHEPIEFDGSNSYDIDGAIIDWIWDFGDGTKEKDNNSWNPFDSSGMIKDYSYNKSGI